MRKLNFSDVLTLWLATGTLAFPACNVEVGNSPGSSTGSSTSTGGANPSSPTTAGSDTGSATPDMTTGSSSTSSGDTGSPDSTGDSGTDKPDPFLWLEEVESKSALDWVKARNAETKPLIESAPSFAPLRDRLLSIYNSKDKIPGISKLGDKVNNFWRDETHERGLWRRTTLESYKSDNTQWETLLDLDQLAKDEEENWVWGGASCLRPNAKRCLVALSGGGSDASTIREFDTETKAFVKDGFFIPPAKSSFSWIDMDHLFVGTDFGPGSLTDSGYPRTVRRWTRGTALKDAPEVFYGETTDVSVGAYHIETLGIERDIFYRRPSFHESRYYLLNEKGERVEYMIPGTASMGFWGEWMLITLKEDWKIEDKTWKQGALLIIKEAEFLAGKRNFELLFEPTEQSSLLAGVSTKDYLLVSEMENVKGRLFEWSYNGSTWTKREVPTPGKGSFSVSPFDRNDSNDYLFSYNDHLTPSTLYMAKAGTDDRTQLRQSPEYFDTTNLKVDQFFATSKDGTKIPYFQITRKDVKLDGKNPTILYGYGGFEIPLEPSYSSTVGAGWLEKGGSYVVANIRGGGEFGPRWHRAALKENRQRAYDDFIAVGEDLIARGLTSPAHLGIQGASNGGLLTGVMLVQRPDLWGAVISGVPLLDMKRFHKLLAGASWVGEYGNPDIPEEWAYLSKYSPYHNVKPGVNYPPLLMTTSTKDDRVHPAHARKMLARMTEQGHKKLYYYENIEGGHGGAANNKQAAYKAALEYTFMAQQLGLK